MDIMIYIGVLHHVYKVYYTEDLALLLLLDCGETNLVKNKY